MPHPWLDAPKRNDPWIMLVRSSIRGNAAGAKSRRPSHNKKRYVSNACG
jgi:hypothetical protein